MTVQVYWPSDLLDTSKLESKNAVILGQLVTESTFVVITLLHYNSDIEELETTGLKKNLTTGKYEIEALELSVIGYFGKYIDDSLLCFKTVNNTIIGNDLLLIVYEPPLPTMLQFYSAEPITLSFLVNRKSRSEESRLSELLKNYHPRETTQQEQDFNRVVDSLNLCWIKRNQLIKLHPDVEIAWDCASFLKEFPMALQEKFGLFFVFMQRVILRPFTKPTIYAIVGIRHLMLILLRLLNFRFSAKWRPVVEISATAQQIDLRLQQFSYIPIQYLKTTKKFRSTDDNAKRLPIQEYPEYIRLYNTLWLIVNDIIIGMILRSLLKENITLLTDFFNRVIVSRILYSDLNSLSVWLMSSPGGIKLNNELSAFLSDLFRWIIEFWKALLVNPLAPYTSYVVSFIVYSSVFGATFSIAIFSDLLSLITFHIYCFYYASAKIFNWQLNIIGSLFYLFHGKKKNVLRNRVDLHDYELDQLLLGTLMFTVLMFLLPTLLAFYLTFTVTQLSISIIVGSLEIFTALLNHFPIFVILLRLKDYKRIPGGVRFLNKDGYLNIAIKPISISQMFEPFNNVLNKMKSAYISKKTLSGIMRGHPVHVERHRLYKLLYSALPATPVSTSELWDDIKGEF